MAERCGKQASAFSIDGYLGKYSGQEDSGTNGFPSDPPLVLLVVLERVSKDIVAGM